MSQHRFILHDNFKGNAPSVRSRWLFAVAVTVTGFAALLAGGARSAFAGYTAGSTGTGSSVAQLVPAGATPESAAQGRDMTVTWAPTLLTGGTPASGYIVRRYNISGSESAVIPGCQGVVSVLSCVENAVPAGTWQYTITPVLGTWTGTEGAKSAPQVTSSASLTLTSPTITSLPVSLDGTISGFVSGTSLSFHLDSETGPTLTGSPSVVPTGGQASITVVIPVGTDDSPHSVFAVDSAGTVASHAIVIIDPPVLTSLQMFDVNSNGKVDRLVASFSKNLAAYAAGTTPWTLANVPSGGTLATISVSGSAVTLVVNEGGGAADTSVGGFTVALAPNAAGVRDAAGQTASFPATAPGDGAPPAVTSRQMFDTNANGKVDRVVVGFSESLATYTAGNTPWTLVATPSGGVLDTVTVAGSTATLAIIEGSLAADTAVGSFTVALASASGGIADVAGNLASSPATPPLDKAAPVRVAMSVNDLNGNGKVDRVLVSFSEPLAAYTSGTAPWTFVSAPSAGTLASVTVGGSTATLAMGEGAGAASTAVGSFTVALAVNAAGIRDAAANLTSFAATAPTDGAAPVLLTLSMLDSTLNGKVDSVTAVFSETLSTYTAGVAPWTLTGVPSGGTLASVAVATTTATLTITEGAGAADTTVGSLTVALATNANGVTDAAGNLASFVTAVPLDKAKPARLSMVMKDINGNGKIDQVAMSYSETLSAYSAGIAPWTLTSAPSTDTLASVAVSGSTATLTLNEGVGAATTAIGSFKITLAVNAAGIRDAAANLTSFAATAPTDGAAPVLLTLSMLDSTLNGKVDRITAVFSETLSTYTAGVAPWTLTGVPSGGTLASVAVATTTATLTITEGAGAADTTVGSLTVALATNAAGIRDAAANLASFASTVPNDAAAPGRLTMVMKDINGNGRIDQILMTFSEVLATDYTAGSAPWTFAVAPSGATFGSIAIAGNAATMTLNEGAGAATTAIGSFKITLTASAAGIRDAAANGSSFASTAPTDGAAPALVTITATDINTNGKIDRVTAVFSETLSAYTAGIIPWTLTNAPSGATLASVAVATTTATLTLIEGVGPADTSIGAFSVALAASATGVRDAVPNLAAFSASAPLDGAGPVAISVAVTAGTTTGKIEAGDTISITFSEPLLAATVPVSTTVTESDPTGAGNDTLTITGITNGARNTGSDFYIVADGTTADFTASTTILANNNTTVTVTVGGTCQNTGCATLGQALVAGILSYAPATSLTDTTGNVATGTRTDTIRIF